MFCRLFTCRFLIELPVLIPLLELHRLREQDAQQRSALQFGEGRSKGLCFLLVFIQLYCIYIIFITAQILRRVLNQLFLTIRVLTFRASLLICRPNCTRTSEKGYSGFALLMVPTPTLFLLMKWVSARQSRLSRFFYRSLWFVAFLVVYKHVSLLLLCK